MHSGTVLGLLLSGTSRQVFHPAIARSMVCTHLRHVGVSCTIDTESVHVAEYMRRMSSQHTEAMSSTHRMILYVLCTHPAIAFIAVTSRTKSVYSTWMKMQRLRCPVDEILDLVAVRVVLSCSAAAPSATSGALTGRFAPNANDDEYSHTAEDVALCYSVLDIVHSTWAPVPMTTKDFIVHPKPNGYMSLHTTVMVGEQPVEIQIRTVEMHDVAEHGTAAHGLYKETQYTT